MSSGAAEAPSCTAAGTAGSDATLDIVSSEYATVAAEQTALENLSDTVADQITARVALFASRTKPR